jgi:hypothetical protein
LPATSEMPPAHADCRPGRYGVLDNATIGMTAK